jgi:hypothetical protein
MSSCSRVLTSSGISSESMASATCLGSVSKVEMD